MHGTCISEQIINLQNIWRRLNIGFISIITIIISLKNVSKKLIIMIFEPRKGANRMLVLNAYGRHPERKCVTNCCVKRSQMAGRPDLSLRSYM